MLGSPASLLGWGAPIPWPTKLPCGPRGPVAGGSAGRELSVGCLCVIQPGLAAGGCARRHAGGKGMGCRQLDH